IPYDRFAANGIAAFGTVDQQIIEAAHLDGGIAFGMARTRRWGRRDLSSTGRLGLLLFFGDHVWRKLGEHLPGGEFSITKRGVQVFHFAVAVFAGDAIEIALGNTAQLHAETPRFLIQILVADLDSLGALAGVDQVFDLVARSGGFDESQPVFARLMAGLSHDLNHVAIAQRGTQRHNATVHLGADTGIADIGVNGVSEIDRRGFARQYEDFAARRESVDFL